MLDPFDGDKNLVNAKNTPVVLVLAIAAFNRAHQWPHWFIYTNVQTEGKTTHIYIADV